MITASRRKLKGRGIKIDGHRQVDRLPRLPESGVSYWIDSPNGRHEYTHSLFRFPAKLHVPVVRWALNTYGRKGSLILDPFTGSGTVQVEALVKGVSSVGIDVDPLACLIAKVKTTPINPKRLLRTLERIEFELAESVRLHQTQETESGADITERRYLTERANLPIPSLPNITHWFRKYVIVDLANILNAIEQVASPGVENDFFSACLAAIIRRVSNADPAPVSGLEVTRIQAKKNATRKIRVFREFYSKTRQEIQGMNELWEARENSSLKAKALVINSDAISGLKTREDGEFSLVVSSPPYCRAVEYSRRHQLEMYWLGLVKSQTEHVALAHSYIGRRLVRESDWKENGDFGVQRLDKTIRQIADIDPHKGRTVKQYFYSMSETLEALARALTKTGTAVCVVGNSTCCGVPIPTANFIAELASEYFQVKNHFSYALQNHSMQYGLWNGDGIKHEHVLVLKPKK